MHLSEVGFQCFAEGTDRDTTMCVRGPVFLGQRRAVGSVKNVSRARAMVSALPPRGRGPEVRGRDFLAPCSPLPSPFPSACKGEGIVAAKCNVL